MTWEGWWPGAADPEPARPEPPSLRSPNHCAVCARLMTPHRFKGRDGRWRWSETCSRSCTLQLRRLRDRYQAKQEVSP